MLTPSVVAALRFRMWKGIQIDDELLVMPAHLPMYERYVYIRELSGLWGIHEYDNHSVSIAPFIE